MFWGIPLILSLAVIRTTHADLTSNIRIHSNNSRFIDEYGRERIFHGINSVYKTTPYLPVPPATWVIDESVIAKFKYYGINVIRLGLMYAGAMPSKGEINSTYLDMVESLVKLCQENEMYVLLDSHQDIFSEEFGGDGFPSWSFIQGNARPYPYPLNGSATWELYYMTEVVNSAFGHFYNNSNNLQSYYTQFWSESAKRFAKYSHVLGYELINEPWCGDIYQDALVALPYNAYSRNLQPLYDVLSEEIWNQDPDHLVFFEPVTWDVKQSGISHTPGYSHNANKTVLSYHYYIPPMLDISFTIDYKFRTRDAFRCGSMLTEFQIWEGETDEFKSVLEATDDWKESWIGWMGNPLQLFTQTDSFLASFAHPYPQKVAGTTSEMKFHPDTNIFTLNYTTSAMITSNETVIFVNKDLHYPHDFKTTSLPADGVTIKRDDANHRVIVYHDVSTVENDTSVVITIAPLEELFVDL